MEHKVIFHIDLNSFFASCHIADDESLYGKPVVVSGKSRRGVILTASYEARKYGIHAGMPIKLAYSRCKNLIVLTPDFSIYKRYSNQFFDFLAQFSNNIEAGSIDEAYIDMTEYLENHEAVETAKTMLSRLLQEHRLPASIGIAPNKFLAKMASDMKKPLGITVLRKRDIKGKLHPLPIEEMFGIGKKTVPRLHNIGIKTIGDLANYDDTIRLQKILGSSMNSHLSHANGNGNSYVGRKLYGDLKQIGNSSTFYKDTDDVTEIKDLLNKMVNKVYNRMVIKNVASKTFSIQLRNNNFETITRSKTLPEHIDKLDDLLELAYNLFDEHWDGSPIRLVGFSTGEIVKKDQLYKQLNLFEYMDDKDLAIEDTINQINKKYSSNLIKKGDTFIDSN